MKPLPAVLCLLLVSVVKSSAPAAATAAVPPSYLTLTVTDSRVTGQWKIPATEVATALGLPLAVPLGQVRWEQLEGRREDIEELLRSHLWVRAHGVALQWQLTELAYGLQGGLPYIAADLSTSDGAAVMDIAVEPQLLLAAQPGARCLLQVVWSGAGMHQGTLLPGGPPLSFDRATAARSGFLLSLSQGVWHIWTGYDHILFLITLLMPSVFRQNGAGREAVPRFASALLRVVIIVSAFTLAHSITLTCAALRWVSLPSRLVEPAIAFSIVVAALFNFLPTTAGGRGAWLALGFGLLHGFGFAGALSQLGSQGAPAWRTISSFNLGVEAGQLAIVALYLPLAFVLRETRFYRTGVLYGGSAAAAMLAAVWFLQRAFF